jgi:hypothetical protein
MSEYIRVKGNIIEKTGGTSRVYAKGGIEHNSNGFIDYFAENHTYGEPEKYVPKQPENSVNVYVGMFFDGTGNNRFNSDSMYYSKIKSNTDRIDPKDIPANKETEITIEDKDKKSKKIKVKITDRDSYWNPYSNIAKLFDLYKEIKTKDYKDDEHPEYGKHVILKQYVEGIGTKQGKPDDFLGSGLARDTWGVISRVHEGIEKVVQNQFSAILKDKKINKIVIDVFGFSRGAAAARHFCNEVMKEATYRNEMINDPYDKYPLPSGKKIIDKHAGGQLGFELSAKGHLPVGETYKIEIRFLGIFDTVISDIVVKENMGYKLGLGAPLIPYLSLAPLAQEALPEIKTNIGSIKIGKVFHIKASTEWRKNFAFTPSEQGYTLGMIGSHSDIGGGYAELTQYEPVLSYFDVPLGNKEVLSQMQKFKQFYTDQFICTNEELQFVNTYDHVTETSISLNSIGTGISSREIKAPNDFPDVGKTISKNPMYQVYQTKNSDHYVLKDARYISNKYSLVPMQLMLEKAIENDVPFFKGYDEARNAGKPVKNEFEHQIPENRDFDKLRQYLEIMRAASKEENKDKNSTYEIDYEIYKHIHNKYVHLSAHYGGFENDFLTVQTGDHHFLSDYVFINEPVEPIIKEDKVIYKREIYVPKS